jgi:hypothetical protein
VKGGVGLRFSTAANDGGVLWAGELIVAWKGVAFHFVVAFSGDEWFRMMDRVCGIECLASCGGDYGTWSAANRIPVAIGAR